ncbi:CcdB family protein [Parvibaculum sp.]|jgi:toxin CcdB|uniref:CcdB family protein n=1 Tax=Parvibaculum sp. TaxID=2024848 RepID=UPI000C622B7E|nr:CcdB family protein [Parvibaculum sp.]HAC59016.1 plasmid maintenance protein CcdB [Rhodobiaceae bacterium]MAU62531.1 plasmid maintenance protein CcdB [Parvibaculum sp.]MBO6666529.1 CcdB family protein [Parvibaculum sp.]MBO6690876.1 CcdB family protein [Parvibaculum sp.]MBO6713150.1 CcdB family protein [Parvibaculum sp.]|tara:strand:+ start:3349 stop:3666 length:318 start_codon:yes stop_codon:yes gene_type:complete
MAALDIHANPEPRTRGAMPYVIELQANLLSDLNTRLVAPLAPARLYKGAIPHLNPVIDIAGEPHVLLTHQMAALPARLFAAPPVANAEEHRYEIVAAVDFLVTGI